MGAVTCLRDQNARRSVVDDFDIDIGDAGGIAVRAGDVAGVRLGCRILVVDPKAPHFDAGRCRDGEHQLLIAVGTGDALNTDSAARRCRMRSARMGGSHRSRT